MGAQIKLENAVQRVHHSINKFKDIERFAPIRGRKTLDVGCGTGNSVIAAKVSGAESAVGFDRNLNEFGDPHLIETCGAFNVDPRDIHLVEGSFEDVGNDFDIITCIDVIEHVDKPHQFIGQIASALKNGGVALIDTSPLFYSPMGHHLFQLDREAYPWVHLWRNFDQICEENNVDNWSLERYRELNRLRHHELVSEVIKAGFVVLRHQIARTGGDILNSHRHKFVSNLDVEISDLLTSWVHLIVMKQN